MPKGYRRSRARLVSGDLKTLEVARKLKEDRVDAVPVRSSPLAPRPFPARRPVVEPRSARIRRVDRLPERAASLEAERPPTGFMSVTTLVKVRAWIRSGARVPPLIDPRPNDASSTSSQARASRSATGRLSSAPCATRPGSMRAPRRSGPGRYFDDTREAGGNAPRPCGRFAWDERGRPSREMRALSRVSRSRPGRRVPRLKSAEGVSCRCPSPPWGARWVKTARRSRRCASFARR